MTPNSRFRRPSISSAIATAWRSLVAEVMRKKSANPESIGSSSRMRVSSPFLLSQAAAAAWTRMRVCSCEGVVLMQSEKYLLGYRIAKQRALYVGGGRLVRRVDGTGGIVR